MDWSGSNPWLSTKGGDLIHLMKYVASFCCSFQQGLQTRHFYFEQLFFISITREVIRQAHLGPHPRSTHS